MLLQIREAIAEGWTETVETSISVPRTEKSRSASTCLRSRLSQRLSSVRDKLVECEQLAWHRREECPGGRVLFSKRAVASRSHGSRAEGPPVLLKRTAARLEEAAGSAKLGSGSANKITHSLATCSLSTRESHPSFRVLVVIKLRSACRLLNVSATARLLSHPVPPGVEVPGLNLPPFAHVGYRPSRGHNEILMLSPGMDEHRADLRVERGRHN